LKGAEILQLTIGQEVYALKRANLGDLNKVLGLLVNAAVWLKTKGTTQWDYYIRNLEGNTQEVLDSIENGATYILLQGEVPVASITLEDKPNEWDRDIWGKDAEHESVVYLHRLVVHRDYAGKNVGTSILEWAEEYVKTSGKSLIRFDCLASNEGLNNYYQKRYELKEIANIYGKHCKYEVLVGKV
jgi:GNAT superfamily N-acetyltransferase